MRKVDFENLKMSMLSDYNAVDNTKNPISFVIKELNAKDKMFLIGQYSIFSKSIVSFLLPAHYIFTHYGWQGLSDEIVQNISEELNLTLEESGESQLPHYNLLTTGFKESFGEDLTLVEQSKSTRLFFNSILTITNDPNPALVAGATYALEATATPELEMVYDWVKTLFIDEGVKMNRKVATFFESHINEIEIEHENRLKNNCNEYIRTENQAQDFSRGFFLVMEVMDEWWSNLGDELAIN